ncbi:MAG: anti-sigma regulatory factor [Verrucomicrobiia bacterium]
MRLTGMAFLKEHVMMLTAQSDVVLARQTVRQWAADLGLSLVDETKIVTAASELARNTLVHGRGGTMRLQVLKEGARNGLRLIFEDQGPGIPDVELAMRDGYTTGNGLGLGLGGAKRLVNEFEIQSKPGVGTRVTVTRWKQTSC